MNEEPKSIKIDVPDSMIIVINKCLQKIPVDRYQSIQEFSEDLKNNQKVITADKPNKRGMAYKKTIALISILVTTILFMFIYSYFQSKENKVFDSIAVLPLKNLSGNPKEEWFSDAMTDALITELSNLKSLKVISLTSTIQFKRTDLTLLEIAEKLNVNALVEGSALIIGDQVKITAKLIDAENNQYLWAEDYIRDMGDALVLQEDAAKAIALRVKSTLLPEENLALSGAKKVNANAYEAYGQGKFYLYKFTKPDAEIAIRSFHSALTYQNDFALAYAALAEAYNIMTTLAWISGETGWVKSKEMAIKALDLDNSLAEAHTMLADVKYIYERDWQRAESEFQKAIEINPSYSTGHTWYATFLSAMGRHEEAIAEIKIAQELDPLFFRPKVTAANVYMYARQYQNAEQQLLKLIDLNSALPLAHNRLGKLYLLNGRYKDAILELEKACELANDSTCVPRLAQAFALNGNIIKARQLLNYWLNSKQKNIQATEVALAYLSLGEKKKAFEWLYKAYNDIDDYMHKLLVDPSFDPIRNDKRYIDLLKKIGLNP